MPETSPLLAVHRSRGGHDAPSRRCATPRRGCSTSTTPSIPRPIDLFAQIDIKMRAYIADFLGLDLEAAYALQKRYFEEYGTSMRGLMDRHGMDPTPFLAQVHDIDVSVLDPAPALGEALASLPGRKLVFTNASTAHAERVLRRLGVDHHFHDVFDIVAADFRPKPEPEIYRKLVDRHRDRAAPNRDGGGHGAQSRPRRRSRHDDRVGPHRLRMGRLRRRGDRTSTTSSRISRPGSRRWRRAAFERDMREGRIRESRRRAWRRAD